MNFIIKKFLLLLTFAHCVAFSFKQAAPMSQAKPYRVCAPTARLLFPGQPSMLPASCYFLHSNILREHYYQFGQALYGEKVAIWTDNDYTTHLQGSFEQLGQLLYETTGNNFTRFNNMTSEENISSFLEGLIPAFVQQPTAQLLHADKTLHVTIPMGSALYVQESNEPEFFECFEYKTQTFNLIRKSDVLTQQQLATFTTNELRSRIVAQAEKLLGQPYQWGGRSALENSGFDCAGLIEATYRSCNQKIVCSVQRQFEQSKEIQAYNLKPGDLIFFYQNKFGHKKAEHVIMYTKFDTLIEACPLAGVVTKSQFSTQFKAIIMEVQNGDSFIIEGEVYYISFRSLL